MIQFIVDEAEISKKSDGKWLVTHPQNSAVIAYCDNAIEAQEVVIGLNKLASTLRNRIAKL